MPLLEPALSWFRLGMPKPDQFWLAHFVSAGHGENRDVTDSRFA